MSILTELMVFAMNREPWQQDAIRRLYTQASLSQTDSDDLYLMMKAHHRLIGPESAPQPDSLKATDSGHCTPRVSSTVLNSIENVTHCNRLASNQKLRFAIAGITLIYGDNGCGKSGYCRVLKKLCRVRDGAQEQILGDAYSASKYPPAEALIRYTLPGGDINETTWKDGTVIEALSCISVFDAKTVPLYADKERKIEFLPQGLDVLPRLGDLCKAFVEKLTVEIRGEEVRLSAQLPAVASNTAVATVFGKLTTSTRSVDVPTEDAIKQLSEWTDAHATELQGVIEQLNADPQKLIDRCTLLKTSTQRLIDRLNDAERTVGTKAVADLCEKIQLANTAREAATLAANNAFGSEPLTGVGGAPWRLMFEHARNFSAVAYPGDAFPQAGEDKLCLLCQQPLGGEASDRLRRFDEYLKGTTEEEAKRAETVREAAVHPIKTWSVSLPADADTTLAGLEELIPTVKGIRELVTTLLIAFAPRKAGLIETYPDAKAMQEIAELPPNPNETLRAAILALDELIIAQEAAKQPERRAEFEDRHRELEARRTLHENLAAVLDRRAHLIRLIALKKCKDACDTRSISLKATELRRQFLTASFEKRINNEIDALGLDRIPLKVSDRSQQGTSFLGVELESQMKVSNSQILSEGEFRALALACFLADISSIEGHAGIIIDDPVSSLDHVRTVAVAKRLVEEAKYRQVIIFTHDLCLYHEVMARAGSESVPMLPVWIRHTSEHGFGTVFENDEPWQAKKVGKRISHLEELLSRIKKLPDQNSDEYRYLAKDFYTDLRETWERLVEEQLFNGVVTRFQPGVKTQSLNGACVEDEDHQKVYFGMARASEYSGHDRTSARQVDFPGPDVMQIELKELKDYSAILKNRMKTVSKRREDLEKPPTAAVA